MRAYTNIIYDSSISLTSDTENVQMINTRAYGEVVTFRIMDMEWKLPQTDTFMNVQKLHNYNRERWNELAAVVSALNTSESIF